jgi:hypothetical protein
MTVPVMAVAKFERFFRLAAGLDVDKNDLKRCDDFVNHKLYDLCLLGRVTAKTNGRDVIQPYDLPITKGLQESVRDFDQMDEEIELVAIVDNFTALPPLDADLSDEAESWLPRIAGGLSVALARTIKIVYPRVSNPQSTHWETAFRVFDLLL